MFRMKTIVLAGITALSLGVAATPKAEAGPQTIPAGHTQTRIYWVYYRTCPHDTWKCYGGYYNPNHAIQAVNYFRHRGYDSFYR